MIDLKGLKNAEDFLKILKTLYLIDALFPFTL